MNGLPAATAVLSCGHERGECAPGARAVGPCLPAGRELGAAVETALRAGDGPVCVVPMTLGRDPRLVADSARALRWAAGDRSDRVVLAEPFGNSGHLIGWLRAAALRAGASQAADDGPAGEVDRALLITAVAADPFDDAELYRIARLVRQFGRHRLVEVAFRGGDPDVAEGVERCLRLGAGRVNVVAAGFGPALPEELAADPRVADAGPLLTTSAVRRVVDARVEAAMERLHHGDNGIGAGLDAEHGHGYAHSHADPSRTHAAHTHTHRGHNHSHHH